MHVTHLVYLETVGMTVEELCTSSELFRSYAAPNATIYDRYLLTNNAKTDHRCDFRFSATWVPAIMMVYGLGLFCPYWRAVDTLVKERFKNFNRQQGYDTNHDFNSAL